MKYKKIKEIILTPNKIIELKDGPVLRGLRNDEDGYSSFGEVYFSEIYPGSIKGWKKHKKMIMNIIVPKGKIRFVFFDDRKNSDTYNCYQEEIVSRLNYLRLTIPPNIWFGFENIGKEDALLMNLANIKHDPDEVENKDINVFKFK